MGVAGMQEVIGQIPEVIPRIPEVIQQIPEVIGTRSRLMVRLFSHKRHKSAKPCESLFKILHTFVHCLAKQGELLVTRVFV
jgi:hypothetical protein